MAFVHVRLRETTGGGPGVGYRVEVVMSVKARIVIPDLIDDVDDDIGPGGPGRPRRPRGPRSRVVFRVAPGPRATATTGPDGRVEFSLDTRGAERELIGGVDQIPGASGQIVQYRTIVRVAQPSGARLAAEDRVSTAPSFRFSLRIPRRRVVVLDVDGLRWDVLYRHLTRVRDAGAGLDRTYRFEPRPDASHDTVIGRGKNLRSGLGHLCFGSGNGMVDVRLARAAFPSFTFPSHATMFTGMWPVRHGITGNEFFGRDGAGALRDHRWESLPRAPSLQGFCTSETGDLGAGVDWWVGGFDLADEDSCTDRNRGLSSDLLVPTVYDLLHRAGLRSCVIHNFFHGAQQPWTGQGRDRWWHLSNAEIRTIKDVCSDEDTDQYEPFDSASFLKAQLALRFRPSTIEVERIGVNRVDPISGLRADRLADRLSGAFASKRFRGAQHPAGPPDLMTIYVASVDKASHVDGLANQDTYLAWHDHRLAAFVDDFRRLHPFDFNNTVFAVIADHGHQDLVPSQGITTEVQLALLELALGIEHGSKDVFELLFLLGLLEGRIEVLGEGMNQYIYLSDTTQLPDPLAVMPDPLTAARHLLDTPLPVTPHAALVRDRASGRYRLLARGDTQPVDLGSDRARDVITAQLDPPPPDEAEIEQTSVRTGSAAAERRLRSRLSRDAFATLRIERLIDGLGPGDGGPTDRSPDVVLMASAREAFSEQPSTHGSLGYPLLRVPMLFCGPAVRADEEIADADMVDFTPTLLALLGVEAPDTLDGRALLDFFGRPRRRGPIVRPQPPVIAPRGVAQRAAPSLTPRIRARLHVEDVTPTALDEVSPRTPVWVGLRIVGGADRRRLRVTDTELHRVSSADLELVDGSTDVRWDTGGGRSIDTEAGRATVWLSQRDNGPAERVVAHTRSQTVRTDVPRRLVVTHIELGLPNVPTWLLAAINDVAQSDVLLLGELRTQADFYLRAADFSRVIEVFATRVRTAAVTHAETLLDEALAAGVGDAADGDRARRAARGVAPAWQLAADAIIDPQAPPAMTTAAVQTLRAAAGYLSDDQAADLSEPIQTLSRLPSGAIDKSNDLTHLRTACALAEQVLSYDTLTDVVGLRWS